MNSIALINEVGWDQGARYVTLLRAHQIKNMGFDERAETGFNAWIGQVSLKHF